MQIPKKSKMREDYRVKIPKMEIWKKIFYALFVSMLCFTVTKGDPNRMTLLQNV
jgi:hypothetical protein